MSVRCVRVSTNLQELAGCRERAPEPRRDGPDKNGKPPRSSGSGASYGSGPAIKALLLLGASLVAMAALSDARAQDAQLPPLTVEAGSASGKKKPAPAKKTAVSPAPVPAPTPPAETAATVAPADVPYTTPAGISVVGSSEIGTFGQGKIDAVMRAMPGTFTRENPNNPGVAVNIRGFEGSGRVNMMIDGVRQNFRFTSHEAQGFAYVDPLLLAGIEVQRGAVSTAGGGGALAGTANFRTLNVEDILKPGQSTGVMSIGSWGSNGLGWAGMTAGAVTNGTVGLAGAISGHNQNNYDNGDGQTVPFTYQDPTSGLVKANFKLDEEQSIRLGGVFYDNDFVSNSYNQHLTSNTFTGRYAYNPIGNDLVNLVVNGYRNDVTMKYGTNTTGGGSARGRIIEDEGWGFDATNISRFNVGALRVKSEYGYEYFVDNVDASNVFDPTQGGGVNPSGESSVGSVFSETTFTLGMFDLIGGLRYDQSSLQGSGVNLTNVLFIPAGPYTIDREVDRVDPKVTLAVTPFTWLQPYVTYSESMRAPTISESLTGGVHPGGTGISFAPNPFLDPEIQKGWEYGLNIKKDSVLMRGDAFRFKADYFKMHVDNYITGCVTFDFTTFTPFGYFCNAPGTSLVKGVELQATYDAGFAFAGVTYTYTHTDLPSQLDGLGAHSYLPDNITMITGGVRLIDQTLTLGARGYIASQSYIGIDNVAPGASPYVDGYKLLDLFANYKATNDIDLGLTVTNVFDLAYTPALTTPGTNFTGDTGRGRTFLLTTRAQF